MRICFIYSSVFRHGGIQRVVANISNFLAVNHEVEIICNDRFDIKKSLQSKPKKNKSNS